MLLPVTSSMNWLARRPLIAENSERSMVVPFGDAGGLGEVATESSGAAGGSGRDLDDAGEGYLGTADSENGSGGREADGVDLAGGLGPVRVGVGDGPADQPAGAERHLRGELGRLGEELRGVRGVHRVLVLQLGDHQLEEHVLVDLVGGPGRGRAAGRGGAARRAEVRRGADALGGGDTHVTAFQIVTSRPAATDGWCRPVPVGRWRGDASASRRDPSCGGPSGRWWPGWSARPSPCPAGWPRPWPPS